MDDNQMRLDGNAIGGLLGQLFTADVTDARGSCLGCGAIGALGAQHLYMHPLAPGAVLRCSSCQSVLMVLVPAQGRIRVALRGMAWLDMEDSAVRAD